MTEDDRIPIVETYRGVGIHDHQPPVRIEVVKRAIDHVHGIDAAGELFRYLDDYSHPPEARLFAGMKIEACFALAAENREVRPAVDLVRVRAKITGLDSVTWRDPTVYGTLLHPEPPGQKRAVEREEPLR